MLAELRKHAATGEKLRRLVLAKEAGLVGAVARGTGRAVMGTAKRLGKTVAKHPLGALNVGLAGVGAAGAFGLNYHKFNPAVHRAQLGMTQP